MAAPWRGVLGTILGSSFGISGDGPNPPLDPTNDRYYSNWGGGGRSASGRSVNETTAMQIAAVFASTTLIQKLVASIPCLIYRRTSTGRTEAPEHPLYDVLEHTPNSWQTAYDFRAMMQHHLLMRGNAYAEILPGPRGAVDRLEPLHPDQVRVGRGADGIIRYQINAAGSPMRTILQEDMFHIRSPTAPWGLVGVAPLTLAREGMGLALAAEEHGGRMFAQGVSARGVVELPAGKPLGDVAFQRLKASFEAAYSGLGNAGKTPILEGGATFRPVTLTADDVQFLSTRKFQVEDIARWFDVPPVLLGVSGESGVGIEAIMIRFVRTCLMPWLRAWEGAIRRDLILAPNIYSVRFDTEEMQRGDSTALANFIARLVLSGVITRNEGRAMVGYDPLRDGEKLLVPVNTTTADNMPDNSGPGSSEQPGQPGQETIPGDHPGRAAVAAEGDSVE